MKSIRKIMAVAICICLIININICGAKRAYAQAEASGSAAAESGYSAAVADVEAGVEAEAAGMAVAGAEATDWSALSGSHELERYEDNEAAVLYRDGRVEVLRFGSREELAAGLEALSADESVELYQPNFRYGADADPYSFDLKLSDDRYVLAQWYLRNSGNFAGAMYAVKAVSGIDINADWAWYEYEPKRDVTVAVIDTGIDRWELDLAGRIWENTDEIQGNGKDDDGNGYIDDRWGWNFYDNNNVICDSGDDDHGTHCASVIAARADNGYGIKGIAHYDNIKIMPVKVLGGSKGQGSTAAIVDAIRYAEDNGAKICNFSLGTETDDFIMKKTILSSKMLFVAAAGNSRSANVKGKNLDHHANYPAAYGFANVLTVANLAADGRLHTSSDYGVKSVHIAAPGTDIAGATVGDGFVFMTGTSMAAPMVTATAALVYTASENMTVTEVKECILDHVRPLASLNGYVSSGGMLDAGAAVKYTVEKEKLQENSTDTGSADQENADKIVNDDVTDDGGAVADGEDSEIISDSETDISDSTGKDEKEDPGKETISIRIPVIDKRVEIKLPEVLVNIVEKIIDIGGRLF